MPLWMCDACGASLIAGTARVTCGQCGDRYERRDGVFRPRYQVPATRDWAALAAQYRAVRDGDGYRRSDGEYYRRLPWVLPADPRASEWTLRRASYRTFERDVLRGGQGAPRRVVDLGAGCGWLAARLTAAGHAVVAVDRLDDEQDGLGACRWYPEPFAAVQADFHGLPFGPAQFDLAVFNASLHYAADARAALAEARRVVVPGGMLVVLDSPIFRETSAGEEMVASQMERFRRDRGIPTPARIGRGFLTYADLAEISRRLGLKARFVTTRGPWRWQARRAAAWVRLGRAPAAFGVWVAR